MRKINLKVLLPILCSIALLFSVVGTMMASGATQIWRDEPNEVEKILERDGYLEGIWYPWITHSYLGHGLCGNKLFADTLGSDSWLNVGIDQYGEVNLYREIYNLKALGFNIMGYEGSPYGEGVIYDANGNVLGIEEEYVKNVRRFLNICKEVGMPVLWTVCFHTTSATDYYKDGKLAWDIVSQAYANPEVADQYAENFVAPLCDVLAEYPETVVMVSSGVELENEVNDSAIGNQFSGGRVLYGVNKEPMMYFLKAINDKVNEKLPNVATTNSGNAADMTWYKDINFDFLGRNQYTHSANATDIESIRATAPVIATEFGFGEGVQMEDEIWTIKQIRFRDNFIAEGYAGWMYWCWQPTGYGGVFDLLAADGKSTTDFRAGAYTIYYNALSYRAAHRGEEAELDAPALFCNSGSGTVEWIASRQASSIDILRSTDSGKTWTTLVKGAETAEYESNFKGHYVDEEIANHEADGTTVIYKVVAHNDDGLTAESAPSNEALVLGPPIDLLADYNASFETGDLTGWTEWGTNYATNPSPDAHYEAKVVNLSELTNGEKKASDGDYCLEFRYIITDPSNPAAGEWFGVWLGGVDCKPDTQYVVQYDYMIADPEFDSIEGGKMSGYIFIRGLKADGSGNGTGNYNDEQIGAMWMNVGNTQTWTAEEIRLKTNKGEKIGVDFRAVQYVGLPNWYYIDNIRIFEVR